MKMQRYTHEFESIGGDLEARVEGRYIVVRVKGTPERFFMSRGVVLKMLEMFDAEKDAE